MVHFDEDDLNERLGGDREILQEVLSIFFDSVEPRVRELRDALSGGDRESLRKLGHTVRGVALTVSAPHLAQLGGALEKQAPDGSDDNLALLVQQICTEYAVVSETVRGHQR